MTSKVYSASVIGLDCIPIDIEVDVSGGDPFFKMVGLPDTVVQESRSRVDAAIKNTGSSSPEVSHRVIVNLAPADIRKEGPSFDLPIAMGFLLASFQLQFDPEGKLFVGELSLNGDLKPTKGILPIAIMAKEKGYKTIFLPEVNAKEAALIDGIEIIPAKTLKQLMMHLEGTCPIEPYPPTDIRKFYETQEYLFDFAYVKGQDHAKRAMEIAASGGHNALMQGPPGSGKTLIARTLPSILPPLTMSEALEVTKIYSVSGILPSDNPLVTIRPFRTPHHTASGAALVGGGAWPKPGEISLAHRGILFLDEFPEFSRQVLENLRQPLEDHIITVSRAQGTLTFPAKFTLIAAMNPCPCGYATDPEKQCTCSTQSIIKYQKRISGPLLDRIDMHIEVARVKHSNLIDSRPCESSAEIRKRVINARQIQEERFKNEQANTNSEMSSKNVQEFCNLVPDAQSLLQNAIEQLHLSARAYYRILKLSRTIADLDLSGEIKLNHVAEAIQYRPKVEII